MAGKTKKVSFEGQVYDFPDDATDDEIFTALSEMQMQPAPEPAPKSTMQPAAIVRFTGERVPAPAHDPFYSTARGAKDVIDAGAQMLTRALPESVVNAGNKIGSAIGLSPMTAADIDRDIAESNRAYEAERSTSGESGIDIPRMLGSVLAAAPLAGKVPVGSSLLGSVGTGAAASGIYGALTPVSDPSEQQDFWQSKAMQTATSAGLGGALSGALNLVGRAAAPQVDRGVQYLMDRGVTPTIGQIQGGSIGAIENKLTSVPFAGDMIKNAQRRSVEQFNRAAMNEVLAPIGGQVDDIGRAGFDKVDDIIGNAYDDVLSKVSYQADDVFKAELASAAQGLAPEQTRRFASIIKEKLSSRLADSGTLTGQQFKVADSELGRLARGYRKEQSLDTQMLGEALDKVRLSLRQNLARVNPEQAPALNKANEAYARFVRLRDAVSRLGTDEGVFTPAQLQNAVRSGDSSVGKGQFARGEALMQDLSEAGKKVLTTFPNSGTADRIGVGAGALGMYGMIDPYTAAAVAGGIIPYTQAGQRILSRVLTQRPEISQSIGGALRSVAGPAGGVLGGILGN